MYFPNVINPTERWNVPLVSQQRPWWIQVRMWYKNNACPAVMNKNFSFPDRETKAAVVLGSLPCPSSSPLLSLAPTQTLNLDVITLSSSASWRSWRSGGRAGNGSNGTSPRGRRSKGCRSTTGRTLSRCHPDPCPSSRGCRALCPYLTRSGVEAAEMNLRRIFPNSVSSLPGMVLSRTKPKNPPMNMWVVKSTTMTWSSSFTPANRDIQRMYPTIFCTYFPLGSSWNWGGEQGYTLDRS